MIDLKELQEDAVWASVKRDILDAVKSGLLSQRQADTKMEAIEAITQLRDLIKADLAMVGAARSIRKSMPETTQIVHDSQENLDRIKRLIDARKHLINAVFGKR